MADEKVLKGVKSFLRSVLISSKNGVAAYNLQREYKEMVGEFLPFKKLGFPTLEDFIQSVPDVVELRWRNGELFYQVVPDEATAHIHELVSKQKSSNKKLRTARKPRGRGGSRFQPRGQFSSGPRQPGPVFHKTLLPSPMGMPAFRPPAQVISPPTPITVNVGNSATGSRTVRLGSKANRLFLQAMTAASSDRNEPKQGPRFEVPPRFRRQHESQPPPPPQQPSRKPTGRIVTIKTGPKVTFPTVENGEMYMETLAKHCKQTKQGLKFDTISAKRDNEMGYVSSIKLKNVVYGSEDVYRTAGEAEEASAMVAVKKLGLLQAKTERKDSSKSDRKSAATSYPPEQLRIVRSRVKEILSNRRNGLWGTVVPFAYKEKFKEEPPPDLIDMIRQWTDIARVELVETTGRDIIYPVLEDTSVNKDTEDKTKTVEKEEISREVMSKEKADTVVKDLIDLHKDTVKRQNSVLKSLVIPREDLLVLDEEVVVYMTYIYNPGYFCVQREDSIIDDMSAELQKNCQSKEAPCFEELQKGQFCAGIYSEDGSWTRAEILQVKDSPPSSELLFVDFGNVETKSPDLIRWLSPETAKIPIQAANCSLYGIEPIETEDEWSRKAAIEFADLVKTEALIAIPKQIYDETIYDVELFLKSDPSVSINQKLVELGVVRTVARPILEEEVDELNEPPQLVLPEGNQWDVYITFVTSTNSIMLRLVGDEYSEKLDAYASKLEESFKNSPLEAPVVMGNLYIAFDDELYHRVRALSQEGKKVTCYFPDHGDTDWQIPDQLRPLDPDVNKLLPYQAIEVSLYGLEDVATNVTALSKLCDLALANTCVAEVVERGDISSVILYDTSQDEDININEAILQAVKADNGGIDSPRTVSPAPGSNPQTPRQVLSPGQSSTDVRERTCSNQSLNRAEAQGSSRETLGPSQNLNSADRLDTQIPDLVQNNSAKNLGPSQKLTLNVIQNANVSENSNVVLSDLRSLGNVSQHDLIQNVPRFTESWTNPTQTNETEKQSEKVDYNSNVNDRETSQSSLHENLTYNLESLKLSNQDEEVPSTTNQYNASGQVIENEPIKSVSDNESKKDWSLDGRTVWNRMEYFKRPLPPNFEIPPIGEYLEIHVNCIHDPSNFVCIPYTMMNELNQLLLDMIDYFHPAPLPCLKKDDIKVGQLYAGHKAGVWYRVKVKQFVSDSLVSVCLVDIGEYSVLMIEELQPLPWTFWKLPLQAINGKLSAIQPLSGNWSEAAKYKFIELAREKDLIGLILDLEAESGVVSFTLIDTSDSTVDLCIDECLVKMNFATYC